MGDQYVPGFEPAPRVLRSQILCQLYKSPSDDDDDTLFLLPGSSYLEPTPCFSPPFYLCQLF